MFYTAYFKEGAPAENRPITFLFNGGPGSPTLWLHMGAYGPASGSRPPIWSHGSAPYRTVANDQSLLDAPDLVFVDAPGTGFSRVAGKDKDKAWFGVDQDIHAFTVFVRDFLSKYGRWKSPKYLYGESYGTMRAAGMTLALQKQDIDLNGVILLFRHPELGPAARRSAGQSGVDLPYVVTPPTYAATAWYHKRAGVGRDLSSWLAEAEAFATTDYALALMKGNDLPDAERQAVAAKLHAYTGLPVDYLPEDQPPHPIWRTAEGTARRQGPDDRHARHALHRRDARSAEQGRLERSAGRRDRRRLYRGVQRLCSRYARLWRGPAL